MLLSEASTGSSRTILGGGWGSVVGDTSTHPERGGRPSISRVLLTRRRPAASVTKFRAPVPFQRRASGGGGGASGGARPQPRAGAHAGARGRAGARGGARGGRARAETGARNGVGGPRRGAAGAEEPPFSHARRPCTCRARGEPGMRPAPPPPPGPANSTTSVCRGVAFQRRHIFRNRQRPFF